LISASHTAKGSSNTFSNQIPTTNSPIDPDVLESLEELGNSFIDDSDGRLVPVQFNTIITGRHAPTVHAVKRILNPVNGYRPESAEHNRNTYTHYNHIVVPFIDMNMATEARDSNKYRYCFVADLGSNSNGIRIEQSQGVEFASPEQVLESSVWQFLTTALYDFGLTRANFIAATKGDSSAV
jgi:hypothetical protein